MAEYGGGGQRGYIIILERRDGKGWRAFALKLRKVLEFFHLLYNIWSRVEKIEKSLGGVPSTCMGISPSVPVLEPLAVGISKQSYAEVLARSGQTLVSTSSHRVNYGICASDVTESKVWSDRGRDWGIRGYQISTRVVCSNVPRGVLGESLDLCIMRSLLVPLKEEVECLIERTNLGLGSTSTKNNIDLESAIAIESKPNRARRASFKPM